MWGPINQWKEDTLSIKNNGFLLYFARRESELLIREDTLPADEPREDSIKFSNENNTDLNYTQLILDKHKNHISLQPILPDKSLIILPKFPLKLPSGSSYSFYTTIPLGVSIFNTGKKNIINEYHFKPLKKTWYGKNQTSGELCYAEEIVPLKTAPSIPHQFVAYIHIKCMNNSAQPVDIKKIKIPCASLSLWRDTATIFHTDRIIYTYTDIAETIDKIIQKPPRSMYPPIAKMSEPRQNYGSLLLNLVRQQWNLAHF